MLNVLLIRSCFNFHLQAFQADRKHRFVYSGTKPDLDPFPIVSSFMPCRPRIYKQWDEVSMVKAVQTGMLSLRRAAEVYNVPRAAFT